MSQIACEQNECLSDSLSKHRSLFKTAVSTVVWRCWCSHKESTANKENASSNHTKTRKIFYMFNMDKYSLERKSSNLAKTRKIFSMLNMEKYSLQSTSFNLNKTRKIFSMLNVDNLNLTFKSEI